MTVSKTYLPTDYEVVRVFIDLEPNDVAWWEVIDTGMVLEQLRDGSAPYIRSTNAAAWLELMEDELLEIDPKARFSI